MSRSRPLVPVLFAGWLVPGGGHFLLGRRRQAVVFFLAITLTFLAGMALCDFGNVSPVRHRFYFLAHMMNGGETILATLLTSRVVEDHVPRHFGMETGEFGTLYTAVAALLNLIVLMDAYGLAVGIPPASKKKKKPRDGTSEETAAAPEAAS
jgi:hypothetical protein